MKLRTLIAFAVYSIVAAAVLSSCFEKPAPTKPVLEKSVPASKKVKDSPVVIVERHEHRHHHEHRHRRNDPFTMHGPNEDCED